MKIKSLLFAVGLASVSVVTFAKGLPKGIKVFDDLSKPIVLAPKHAEFALQMKSNPTTGYSWYLAGYDNNLLTLVKHQFVAPGKKLMGAPGQELWIFRASPQFFVAPQITELHLVYQRPWEKEDAAKDETVKISSQTDAVK
ncbi:MAG: hypothetical protein DHS20C10_09710 [marine bacterium B5-7]|nr:MAG: hypothetical protein DHS20C10_09710 [marine bacterium B5-7]